jgi:hypothetical protein
VTAIHLIIGTLQRMHVFGVENRDTLTHKATGVNSRVLSSLFNFYNLFLLLMIPFLFCSILQSF